LSATRKHELVPAIIIIRDLTNGCVIFTALSITTIINALTLPADQMVNILFVVITLTEKNARRENK
jgi:hypothetical protein